MHWLSFADLDRRGGFLGAVIVSAPSSGEARGVARALGCDPGGVCRVELVPDVPELPDGFTDRLLDVLDLERLQALLVLAAG